MKDWGKVIITKIESGDDVLILLDELVNDNSGFIHNKPHLLDAFKGGNLYGLSVIETSDMFKRGDACMDKEFCKDVNDNPVGWYLLPCLCVMNDDKCELIWSHTRIRNKGFANKFVELLQIQYAVNVLTESIGFWNRCGVEIINILL